MQDPEDQRINNKHFRIRGSHDLKYSANKSRCLNRCGIAHDWIKDASGREVAKPHRCFLAVGHEGFCEFSSICGETKVQGFVPEKSLADDGFLILKTVA